MFVTEELADIRRRKRTVIAHSDVQRAMLQLEILRLRPCLGYVDAGAKLIKSTRPFWEVGGPLIGIWAARRLMRVTSWLPTAFITWKTIKKAWAFWRKLGNRSEEHLSPMTNLEGL